MTELISIKEYKGQKVVNARELHYFLESRQEFANWIKSRIEKYGFIENQDFTTFTKNLVSKLFGVVSSHTKQVTIS